MISRISDVTSLSPHDVRDVLMFRVARLATICDRAGQLRLSRQFGMNLGEWRALSLVYLLAPATIADLARELCLDKGQISRTISSLVSSGLVTGSTSSADRRQTLYRATVEGRRLHDRVFKFVIARSLDLMSGLTAREQAELLRLLDKVTASAAQSFDEVFASQGRSPPEGTGGRATRNNDKSLDKAGGRMPGGSPSTRALGATGS